MLSMKRKTAALKRGGICGAGAATASAQPPAQYQAASKHGMARAPSGYIGNAVALKIIK